MKQKCYWDASKTFNWLRFQSCLYKVALNISWRCYRQPAGGWELLSTINPHHMKSLSAMLYTQPYLTVSVIPVYEMFVLLLSEAMQSIIMVHRENKLRLRTGISFFSWAFGSDVHKVIIGYKNAIHVFRKHICFSRNNKKLLTDLWRITDKSALMQWQLSTTS